MRTSSLVSLLAVLSLSACVPLSGNVTLSDRRSAPSYIYRYSDGSCWADDLWYASCPWYSGPQMGYYYYNGGSYYWDSRFVWRHRIHRPPPSEWRHRRYHPAHPVPRHRRH